MASIKLVKRVETSQSLAWPDAPYESRGVEFWEIIDDAGIDHRIRLDYNDSDFHPEEEGPCVLVGGVPMNPGILVETCVSGGRGPVNEGETTEVTKEWLDEVKGDGYWPLWNTWVQHQGGNQAEDMLDAAVGYTEKEARAIAALYSKDEDPIYKGTHRPK